MKSRSRQKERKRKRCPLFSLFGLAYNMSVLVEQAVFALPWWSLPADGWERTRPMLYSAGG